jgi:hypothetical protein
MRECIVIQKICPDGFYLHTEAKFMLKIINDDNNYGSRLVANEDFLSGDVIHRIKGCRITDRPNYQTIQVGPSRHIEEPWVISHLNHSCQPNTLVDVGRMEVIAARDIAEGEELTFFYPSTEWEMARPFICLCGEAQCVRLAAGAKYLSADILNRYFINQHVRLLHNSKTIIC